MPALLCLCRLARSLLACWLMCLCFSHCSRYLGMACYQCLGGVRQASLHSRRYHPTGAVLLFSGLVPWALHPSSCWCGHLLRLVSRLKVKGCFSKLTEEAHWHSTGELSFSWWWRRQKSCFLQKVSVKVQMWGLEGATWCLNWGSVLGSSLPAPTSCLMTQLAASLLMPPGHSSDPHTHVSTCLLDNPLWFLKGRSN